MVKNLSAMQEAQKMWVWSLGQEDPLKEEMATHFSIRAWKIPWTEEPGGLQSMGPQRVGRDWACTWIKHSKNNFVVLSDQIWIGTHKQVNMTKFITHCQMYTLSTLSSMKFQLKDPVRILQCAKNIFSTWKWLSIFSLGSNPPWWLPWRTSFSS